MTRTAEQLKARIRTVPDWPQPGVQFRDITPILRDPASFRLVVTLLVARYQPRGIDLVAGIDARGFIFGAALAHELNRGFVPIRKKGKLPFTTISEDYALEYGAASLEIHTDAARPGDRVLLIDDLIATGGTLLAASQLIERLGARVVEAAAIVDLPDLGGSTRLRAAGIDTFTLLSFDGH
ncbi:MAG: adenine phosphoribosyltransferase [Rhodocyclaceae bacterium]|nr:adenine phosphoribosyltransferase [Rhodocyclaceae bacterium]